MATTIAIKPLIMISISVLMLIKISLVHKAVNLKSVEDKFYRAYFIGLHFVHLDLIYTFIWNRARLPNGQEFRPFALMKTFVSGIPQPQNLGVAS